ncbi:MAG TPA: acyl-CoA dehydrogenase family protein [Acidimicrobiales bacterium]|nr:acyl-CoA dehydrogenase family protein [Acidimicrobiales bacterium]
MSDADSTATEIEDVQSFAARASDWIRDNLQPVDPRVYEGAFRTDLGEEEELAQVESERVLQRKLFDAGFAGICVPREYGGQGLTPAHQRAFNRALTGYEFPARVQSPTFAPCLAVLLDFGTEEQKRTHVPAILRGEEMWMQLLSEPGGGSDVAGAMTSAVRDGDQWVLNGSKIWTTGAWWSDWGLCLARTNWDVPKHRGLTVFMLPLHQPGIEIHRIEMLNGSKEFCQEFLTDVIVPDSDRVGEVDDGWTVGTRWMFHERMLYESALVTFPAGVSRTFASASYTDLARAAGRLDDPSAMELVGEARMLDVVSERLQDRIGRGIAAGAITDQAAAVARLFKGVTSARTRTIAFELAGMTGGAWTADDGPLAERGIDFLMRQTGSIGGGTTEMARNVISERVLGMPRERSVDRDVPFRDVPHGPPPGAERGRR